MRKYRLVISSLFLLFVLVFSFENSFAKKKRKKKRKITTAQTTKANTTSKDSIKIVHAPGVRNQKSFDSLKAVKTKQKLEEQKK
jgi:Flp pilus assembly protein TadB